MFEKPDFVTYHLFENFLVVFVISDVDMYNNI